LMVLSSTRRNSSSNIEKISQLWKLTSLFASSPITASSRRAKSSARHGSTSCIDSGCGTVTSPLEHLLDADRRQVRGRAGIRRGRHSLTAVPAPRPPRWRGLTGPRHFPSHQERNRRSHLRRSKASETAGVASARYRSKQCSLPSFGAWPTRSKKRSYSIFNITITVIERIPGWTGARRNPALTLVAHLQVSSHIDGSGIVADSIKRQ
jgi:hypothetical protein